MSERKVYLARRVANEAVDGWLEDHTVISDEGSIDSVLLRSQLPGDIAETAEVQFQTGLVSAKFPETSPRTKCYGNRLFRCEKTGVRLSHCNNTPCTELLTPRAQRQGAPELATLRARLRIPNSC